MIGPSFDLVAQRYRGQASALDSLTKKIINGSTGTWGDLKMPPHPDLKIEQVKEIVRWILKNNDDPYQNYIVGIEGAFRTKERPAGYPKGVYILTANFIDHGIMETPQPDGVIRQGTKVGQQTIVLKNIE